MKIFDGVNVNPAGLDPKWQGVLGVAMLLANTLAEADKIRDERVAKEAAQRKQATTLDDVMEQSGLKIAKLQDALTAFMGGDMEAVDAANLIVSMPDPGKLLLEFAKGFRPGTVTTGGPIVTPPPSTAPATPIPAGAAAGVDNAPATPHPRLAKFRPEFARGEMEAAQDAPPAPRPKLAKFRPEFTREGAEATARVPTPEPVAARAAHGATSAAARSPEPAAVSATTDAPARSGPLARAVADRLATCRRKMEEDRAERETRIRCLEAELEQLRIALADHQAGARPALFVVPPVDALASTEMAELHPMTEGTATKPAEAEPEEAGAIVGSPEQASAPTAEVTVTSAASSADEADLPDAESDEEVAQALQLIDEFAGDAAAEHARESARLSALERQLSAMRALVSGDRGMAAAHG